MVNSSADGLSRWTRHTPWVSGPAAAGVAAVDSAVWAAGGPIPGVAVGAVAALAAGVPVAGRTAAQWAGVYWRHRFASYPSSTFALVNKPDEQGDPDDGQGAKHSAGHTKSDTKSAGKKHSAVEVSGEAWAAATVSNDRAGGGVVFHEGTAITAVRVLGKFLSPTVMTGATSYTDNVLPVAHLAALTHQFLDLRISSISVVTVGARVRAHGHYARTFDSFIGPPAYAGQRQMWLIVRTAAGVNVDAVAMRHSAGVMALAATQRIVNSLGTQGIRAKVGTATDLAELSRLGGRNALARRSRSWRAVRADSGWLTSFYYPPQHINTADLVGIWSRPWDSVMQNVTLYPDGRCTATVTVGDPQVIMLPPSVATSALPGEQAAAVAACRPLPVVQVGGAAAVADGPPDIELPVANSGVLIGQLANGQRLVLPFTDPEVTPLRILIRADDSLSKRLILRAAAAGERVTIHTANRARWQQMIMPGISVTKDAKPAAGTTISVTDSERMPSPAPSTIICLTGEKPATMSIQQVGPRRLAVRIANPDDQEDANMKPTPDWTADMDLFADENPYLFVPDEAYLHELTVVR